MNVSIAYSQCLPTPLLGNDCITHEFYIAFFDLIKDLLMSSINYSWEVGELSTSQKQVVITLIEKKGKR